MDKQKIVYFLIGFSLLFQSISLCHRHTATANEKYQKADTGAYILEHYPKAKEFKRGEYSPTDITLPNLYMKIKSREPIPEPNLEDFKTELKVLDANVVLQLKEMQYKGYNPIKNPGQQSKEFGNWRSYAVKSSRNSKFENYSVQDKNAANTDDDAHYYLYVYGNRSGSERSEGKHIKVATDKEGNLLASQETQTDGELGYYFTVIRDINGTVAIINLEEIGVDKNGNFMLKSTYKLANGITRVRTVTKESIEKIAEEQYEKSSKDEQAKQMLESTTKTTDKMFGCLLTEDYCRGLNYDHARASTYYNLLENYGVSKYYDSSGSQLSSSKFDDDKFKKYLEKNIHPITRKLTAYTASYLIPSSD